MKVFVSSTLEVPLVKVQKVIEILSAIPGEITFHALPSIAPEIFEYLDVKYQEPSRVEPLSFAEFFELIKFYRKMNSGAKIGTADYFVLLTTIRNEKKWFSAFQGKNVFINTLEWEKYSNKDSEICIAHQIIENVFTSSLDIDCFRIKEFPEIHQDPIGCINDLCNRRSQIILKMRTAYICDSCMTSFLEKGNDRKIVLHIIKILNHLRGEFIKLDVLYENIKLYNKIIITRNGIQFGEKILVMQDLMMALYIYILKHPKGVSRKSFEDRITINEMVGIYQKFNNVGDEESIRKMCDSIAVGSNYYYKLKSSINKIIRQKLGDDVAQYYQISNDGYKLRIHQLFDPNTLESEV